MRDDDIRYFRRRRDQEMRAADQATDICCRRVHRELARLYGLQLTRAWTVGGISVEPQHGVVSISSRRYSLHSSATDGINPKLL